MRSLRRNQQVVFYKNYEGLEEIYQNGYPTGNFTPKYSDLKSAMLCVSPNKGASETEQFGSIENYDRTITTADTSIDIDEDTVLWVDGQDTDGPWNYIVKGVSRWKNSLQFAIAKVDVTEAEKVLKTIADARKAETVEAIMSDGHEDDNH